METIKSKRELIKEQLETLSNEAIMAIESTTPITKSVIREIKINRGLIKE